MSRTITKRILCHNGFGGCFMMCGLLAHVDEESGQLLRIEGNPDCPTNQGRVCEDRIPHMVNLLYHPDQLMYPLKRVGVRGEGKWRRIGWDQALDEIGTKLKQLIAVHGPECLAFSEGTYRSDVAYWARARLLHLMGNPSNRFGMGTMCYVNTLAMNYAMIGGLVAPVRSRLNCLVTSGSSVNSMTAIWWQLERRMKRKPRLKIICIDPRCTETARQADIWLQIRPGTDCALLLSWLNVIIGEELYDKRFVKEWTNAPFLARTDSMKILRQNDVVQMGCHENFMVWDETTNSPKAYDPSTLSYETPDINPSLSGVYQVPLVDGKKVECKTIWQLLKERASNYPPNEVAQITWVPEDRIVDSARMYATNKPSGFQWCVSTDQIGRNGTITEIVRTILRAVSGSFAEGEQCFGPGPNVNGRTMVQGAMLQLHEKCRPEQRRKCIGSDRFKLMLWPAYELTNPHYEKHYGVPQMMLLTSFQASTPLLFRAILEGEPYHIRALVCWGTNLMLAAANTKRVYKALKSPNLELHVVLDHFMTPSAALADYVLPAASKLERIYCDAPLEIAPVGFVGEAAVKALGERRTEYFFLREIALRLGLGDWFPWKNEEEIADYRLNPLGVTFTEAAKTGVINTDYIPKYDDKDSVSGRPKGFATPSKKVEIYSSIIEKLGYDPLPHYEEPPESPVSWFAKEYPLILTTGGRFRPMHHSEYRQWGTGLREQHPYPLVDIHTDTAQELGIGNGDWVWIETRRGKILQRARVSAGIHPNVVNVQAGWWYPELPLEEPWLGGVWISNANVLTRDDLNSLDVLTGGWPNRALQCKIYKAKGSPL